MIKVYYHDGLVSVLIQCDTCRHVLGAEMFDRPDAGWQKQVESWVTDMVREHEIEIGHGNGHVKCRKCRAANLHLDG